MNKPFLNRVFEKGCIVKQLINKLLKDSKFFNGVNGRGLRFSIFYECINQDSFGRAVTKTLESDKNISIDGKWHRITFSPALDFDLEKLVSSIKQVCDIFLRTERIWDSTACRSQPKDYQKRS